MSKKFAKMFIGEYNHTLDAKGRLAVPAKFRTKLAKGAVVTKGLENCLFLYTKKDWQELAEKISKQGIGQSSSRAFSRLMLAGAMEAELDKQGRIVLPDYLRKYAGLNKKAVINGLYNRIEIWDQSSWEKYKSEIEKDSTNIAEALGELGV